MQPPLALLLLLLGFLSSSSAGGGGESQRHLPRGVDEELLTEFASRSIPDFCNLRSDPGPCDNSTYRFYHSPHTGQCAVFVYRGCRGNRNNFETQLSCLQTCVDPDVCRLPPDQGHGDALRMRYYYSPTSRTCKEFMYKSHGGNGNNFLTKANCLQFCAPRGGQ